MKNTSPGLQTKLLLAGLLLCQTLCMLPNLWAWSAVWDEPGHLAAGLNHWKAFDFRPYSVNPPLCRMLATLPALWIEHQHLPGLDASEISARRGEFKLGGMLMDRDPTAAIRMLRAARCVAMLWPLAGTLLLFWFGRRIFGRGTGWIAAVGWAFNPMVLAHGVLLPPDIPAAVGLMIVALATAAWLHKPGSGSAILLGLAIGVAVLIKTTLLISYPLIPLLGLGAAIYLRGGFVSRILQVSLAVVVSLFVINAGYVWTGSFTRLGDYGFVSELLAGLSAEGRPILGNRFQQTLLGGLPVPLPKDFVLGIDVQYRDFERGGFYPYLAGKWDREGFGMFYVWYYLLKMPTAALLLFVSGFCLVVGSIDRWRRRILDMPLLIVVSAFASAAFLLVSSRTDLNYCQRYSLVSLPLFCLLGAAVWAYCKTKWQRTAVLVLLGWSVVAGISSVPHSLSYYNELAGGISDGRYVLHGDATDWGQDGFRLGRWCQQHPERRPLSIATTGFLSDLKVYGVTADSIRMDGAQISAPLETEIVGKPIEREGWHLVSILHLLHPESPYFPFRYREPVEWIGQTHAVFHVDHEIAKQWREGTLQVLPPMRGHENAMP